MFSHTCAQTSNSFTVPLDPEMSKWPSLLNNILSSCARRKYFQLHVIGCAFFFFQDCCCFQLCTKLSLVSFAIPHSKEAASHFTWRSSCTKEICKSWPTLRGWQTSPCNSSKPFLRKRLTLGECLQVILPGHHSSLCYSTRAKSFRKL